MLKKISLMNIKTTTVLVFILVLYSK
jgi:hypothetical protein